MATEEPRKMTSEEWNRCRYADVSTRDEFHLSAHPISRRVVLRHHRFGCGYEVSFPSDPPWFPIAKLDEAIAIHLGRTDG